LKDALIGIAALVIALDQLHPVAKVSTRLTTGNVIATLPGVGWRKGGTETIGRFGFTSWVSSDNSLVFGVGVDEEYPGQLAPDFGEYKEALGLPFRPGIPAAMLSKQPAYKLERNTCPPSTAPDCYHLTELATESFGGVYIIRVGVRSLDWDTDNSYVALVQGILDNVNLEFQEVTLPDTTQVITGTQ
jgi:hypothetical protein